MLSRKSLAYPIIIIFILIASGSMLLTYFMDVGVLREVCDQLDANQVRYLSQLASNTIDEEINRLEWLLLFLKNRQDLVQGVEQALEPGGNRTALVKTAKEISSHLDMGSLIITDQEGRVLFQSDAEDQYGDKPDIWGLEEALWGEDILLTTRDDAIWTVRAAGPMRSHDHLIGAILINVPVSRILISSLNRFSENMQFFFAGADGQITFHQGEDARFLKKDDIIRSFLEKQPVLNQHRGEEDYTILYTPLSLVDESLCLIVLARNEQSRAILTAQQHRMTQIMLLIFGCCIISGFAFILWLLKPLKILEKDARGVVREFTGKGVPPRGGNEVSNVVNSIRIMTETLRQQIDQLNTTKEELGHYAEVQKVLLREVNHRVKNNLAIIISMLNMEINRMPQVTTHSSLNNLITRIEALATLHSLLSARNWRPLPLGELCQQVILNATYSSPHSEKIHLNVSASATNVSSTLSHYLTLVINELAINSLKYAFRNDGDLTIDLKVQEQGNQVILTYQDNGPGYPAEDRQNDESGPTGLGFEIMRGIVNHSLNGSIEFSNHHGAKAVMIFENDLAESSKGND